MVPVYLFLIILAYRFILKTNHPLLETTPSQESPKTFAMGGLHAEAHIRPGVQHRASHVFRHIHSRNRGCRALLPPEIRRAIVQIWL